METWQTYGVICGGIAGALLGLLFVAVSIRVDVIGRSPELRNRAAQTLALFLVPALAGLVFGLPAQPLIAAGIEFAVVAVATAVAFVVLDHRAGMAVRGSGLSRLLDVTAPRTATCVIVAVGAALLIAGLPAGAYVVAFGTVIAIVGGVVSAWLFLIRIPASA